MSWITIPNTTVENFTGKPLKAQKMDNDLENLYKPFGCPAAGCEEKFVTLPVYKEHLVSEHSMDPEKEKVGFEADLEDATVSRLLLGLMLSFNSPQSSNPCLKVRRSNDSLHVTEVWRRAYLAYSRSDAEVKLRKVQYDWLGQLLDRKLPLTKEEKELGNEVQTVGMMIYNMAESNVRRAFTTLPERTPASDAEPAAVAVPS